ncbi:sugar ABC transporter substrate-binding protein [Metabacillus sediminilitoris]|uniref:sugar ABC transporter substrate-binding protein n=1 Tax=Metabacillus sediminilitoris TaxID=2567941 RepID=UPI001454BB44|nr:sugar ABC transporter substrate-binding protein [Metabacillus sediminilitoris]
MKKNLIVPLAFFFFIMAFTSFTVWFIKEKDKPKIMIVTHRLDIEYWKIFESGAEKAFQDLNLKGKVIAPESIYPISNQPKMLKKVLTQQPDALIVAPIDEEVTIPALMEYKKKNIPVLLVSRDIEWEDKTAFIGPDHYELGEMSGKLLGSMLQPGDQVAIIFGLAYDQVMIDRMNGAKKVLKNIGIEVVTERSGYDDLANPTPVMGSILQSYPNIKGVIATSDRLALEALGTIEEKGMKIPVIGTDGIIEMTEFVESGKVDATIAQNPYDMGYLSVVQALKAIEGDNTEKIIDSGIDIITKDNAEDKINFLKKLLR